jgi:TM2 domain-containing membrane protein YozV
MKDKGTATLLAWLFWPALDFYLGNTGKGVAKLLTLGGFGVWALIDAIRLLSISQDDFHRQYNND